MRKKFQKGISLYFTIILIGMTLAVGLGMSYILISQMKTFREIGYSTKAFYAADSGVEKVLNEDAPASTCSTTSPCTGTLANNSSYSAYALSSTDSSCSTSNYCIKSYGIYKDIKRAIEADY